jgi:hypothetical protein
MISAALEEKDPGSIPEIFAASEEEDPGSMLGICNGATTEEEDLGSMPGICNGATTEEEGGGLGFHTRDLQPVPRGAEVGGEERNMFD